MMNQKKFEALLVLIVPKVVALISKEYALDEISASQMFYNSNLYSLLEQEDTKLWQLSPENLVYMFDDERRTGKITFPEG